MSLPGATERKCCWSDTGFGLTCERAEALNQFVPARIAARTLAGPMKPRGSMVWT
jgi:hypothetical protein